MSKFGRNGRLKNGPRWTTEPIDRLPSVVVTLVPTAKQWPAVTRKRCPFFCTGKPEVQMPLLSLIELPPQNDGTSARRLNESRTASSRCSMTPV